MRHWRTIIQEADRTADEPAPVQDPALRLAAETIRLARLAASTHMILAARLADDARPPEPQALGGRTA